MSTSFFLGMATILVSGVAYGIFAIPLKYSRAWRWENIWLLFVFFSMVLLPWILAVAFVPSFTPSFPAPQCAFCCCLWGSASFWGSPR